MQRWISAVSRLLLVVAMAFGLLIAPASAQAPVSPAPPLPEGITYPEFQGLGCIAGGTIVALSALTYIEVIAAAAALGAPTTLIVPVMATGFAFGCSVGALMAPGLWWMYRTF